MSTRVERFRAGEYVEVPISDPQGKWVRYSDYEKLQSRLAQSTDALRRQVDKCIELQSQLAQVTQERWAAVQALKDVRRIVGAPEIGADTTAWIDDIISKASNHEQPQP